MKSIKVTKRQIEFLKEGNAYVEPSIPTANSTNIASDIINAQKKNPTDDTFIFDTTDYDGSSNNQEPTFTINAENAQEAQQKFIDMQKNPDIKKITDKDARVKVNLECNVIRYTKSELNKILFN